MRKISEVSKPIVKGLIVTLALRGVISADRAHYLINALGLRGA